MFFIFLRSRSLRVPLAERYLPGHVCTEAEAQKLQRLWTDKVTTWANRHPAASPEQIAEFAQECEFEPTARRKGLALSAAQALALEYAEAEGLSGDEAQARASEDDLVRRAEAAVKLQQDTSYQEFLRVLEAGE